MCLHSKIWLWLRYKKAGLPNTHNIGVPQSRHVERKKEVKNQGERERVCVYIYHMYVCMYISYDSIYVKNKINVNSQCDKKQTNGSHR